MITKTTADSSRVDDSSESIPNLSKAIRSTTIISVGNNDSKTILTIPLNATRLSTLKYGTALPQQARVDFILNPDQSTNISYTVPQPPPQSPSQSLPLPEPVYAHVFVSA